MLDQHTVVKLNSKLKYIGITVNTKFQFQKDIQQQKLIFVL